MGRITATQITNIQGAVQRSSRQAVKDILLDNQSNLNSFIWLNPQNKYLVNTIDTIFKDQSADRRFSNYRLYKNQLKEYIGISSILHCKDGWDFFSSAVGLLLEGNIANCIHMAYYAELRAAMSILASDGIGVFNNTHYWIDNSNSLNHLNGPGTHDFVWHTFEEWSKVQTKSNSILNIVEINNSSIFDWLVASGMSPTITTTTDLTRDWLKKWSIDLRVLGQDHISRNDVSYRPQEIKRSIRYLIEPRRNIETVLNNWAISEPTGTEKFRILDYYLLRECLFKYFENQYGRNPLESDITAIMSSLGMSQNTFLEDFLIKSEHPNVNMLFREANKKAISEHYQYRPLPLLARAFLLLRLSTAFVKDSLSYAGYTNSNLDFWWDDVGVKHGLWENGNKPAPIEDLWSDIEIFIESVNLHLSNAHANSPINYQNDLSKELLQMRKFQKPYLWGIGL
ncbi:MAG: hypothetical protein ACHQHN_05305 [Sphingobacteriales bacterium]